MESKERSKQIEEAVIESYKQEEEMMILVFAQWCVNQGVDPEELYRQAYPNQQGNERLQQVLKLVVPKEEAGDIPDETVLGVLSMFGNDDLAMVVAETISARK
ncbi:MULTISPECIES: hypothetical protein [Paenibacillus]|uniref:hypothetical protein n=1 Tax=Paenibacillus TaxID=44249 RepID=UPI001F41F375|nr:hypothetical protein [Paenibacillus sp. JJ-223]CAH1218177.1 hypothetical protein PAECIP111890_04733 [Paenibacillus sp. JJ-223]